MFTEFFSCRKTISCFESLPNELYCEIFDYLEGCKLYEAFSNLNTRFQNLLACSYLRLKIKFKYYPEEQQDRSSHIILSSQHQIVSLTLIDSFYANRGFPRFTIDLSFCRLESLVLYDITSNNLLPLLIGLISLPRLLRLSICFTDDLEEISNIYQAIFTLPVLRYNKLWCFASEAFIPLPIASHEQLTRIEYLNVCHSCALDDLIVILSYTPELRRLSCAQVNESNADIVLESLLVRSNLTHLFITRCFAEFDGMETFLTRIAPHLQVLSITCSREPAYLDADRWERIIVQHLLHLRVFEFKYEEIIDEDYQATLHHERINRFNSKFWRQRNWLFDVSIDTDGEMDNNIVYSILPYR